MDLLKASATVGISYLITKYLFPEKIEYVTSIFLYKTFEVCSRCKFYFKKISNNIDKKKLYFIKDGNKVLELTISSAHEIQNIYQRIDTELQYDFIFYVNQNNYVRYNNLEILIENFLIYNSNFVNFINVVLTYDNIIYDLDLKTDNYYIENNILFDKAFMQYYMLKYYNIIYNDKTEYKISILDNNFNAIELSKTQFLVIQETNRIEECIPEQLSNRTEEVDMCGDDIPDHKISNNKTGWFSFLNGAK
jgi:hypothetical protein